MKALSDLPEPEYKDAASKTAILECEAVRNVFVEKKLIPSTITRLLCI